MANIHVYCVTAICLVCYLVTFYVNQDTVRGMSFLLFEHVMLTTSTCVRVYVCGLLHP